MCYKKEIAPRKEGTEQLQVTSKVACLYDIGMMSGHHMDIVWMTSTVFCIEIDYEGMHVQHKNKYIIFRNCETHLRMGDRSRTTNFGC